MTKLAMIALHNSEEMKKLGFCVLLPVHDEIIGECPEENMQECAELLAKIMSDAAEDILEMPIDSEVVCSYRWFGEPLKIQKKGHSA